MLRALFVLSLILILSVNVKSQYYIEGQIKDTNGIENQYAYLSVVDGWNDFHKIEEQYIIQSKKIDSLGAFRFEGNELSKSKSFFRIHFGPQSNPNLIIGYPRNYFYFILGNQDSISLEIKSISFALITALQSTIAENDDLQDLSVKIDSFRTMAFRASMPTEFQKDTVSINLASSKFDQKGGVIWENRLAIINTKKQNQLARYISEYNNPLLNLYALYSGSFDFKKHSALFTKVATYLRALNVDKKYAHSLDEYIAASSYKDTSKENRILKYTLLLSGTINLIFLLLFLLHKRQKYLAKNKKKSSFSNLTSKEMQIVKLICGHKTNKEIATHLAISTATVKTHINNIYRKLDINSRQELIAQFV